MSRILIADDNKNFALTCTNFLTKEENIEIIDIATNGITALNTYLQERPDILILDLNLPGMSGIEIINKLSQNKEEKRKNNIIVISGDLKNYIPYKTSKVYTILAKPINYDELLDTIYEIQNNIDLEYLEKTIDDLFYRLRLHIPSSRGVNYLKQAVIYCYSDETLFYNISQVYTKIACKNPKDKIKAKNVLWSLESLIDTYERSITKEFLSSFFVYYDNNRRLTPKYLIELIVIYLKHNNT